MHIWDTGHTGDSKQRNPDLTIPSNLSQFIDGDTKAFPSQPRDLCRDSWVFPLIENALTEEVY